MATVTLMTSGRLPPIPSPSLPVDYVTYISN